MTPEKKSNDIPAIIMTGPEISEKRSSFRKYALIAGTAAFCLVIILAAILVGMHLFSDAQKEVIKFALIHQDGSKEEVTSDPIDNIVKHHVNGDFYEAWVIDDFNRDIQTMKIQTKDGINCFIAALNRTTTDDPSEILKYNKPQTPNATYYVDYRAASDPILDSSFLCKEARDACKGIPTYWLFPSCSDSTELSKREKRGITLSAFVLTVIAVGSQVITIVSGFMNGAENIRSWVSG